MCMYICIIENGILTFDFGVLSLLMTNFIPDSVNYCDKSILDMKYETCESPSKCIFSFYIRNQAQYDLTLKIFS